MNSTLGKAEKLKSRKQIDQLFKARKFVTEPPIRLFYQVHRLEAAEQQNNLPEKSTGQRPPVQVGFSCSKKFFKQAARRNRVKRLLREAYRRQKTPLWALCETGGIRLSLFWLYGNKELPTLQETDKWVGNLINALTEKLQKQ